MAAGAVALAGLVTSIVGTAASTGIAMMQASAQRKAAEQNAATHAALRERNMRLVKTEQLAAESAFRRDRARRMGSLMAAVGASGAGFSGSPLDVIADDAAQSASDLFALRSDYANRIAMADIEGQSAVRRERINASEASFNAVSGVTSSLLSGTGESLAAYGTYLKVKG